MQTLLSGIFVVLILALTTYIVISIVRSKSSLTDLLKSPTDLGKASPIMNSDDMKTTLQTQGGSSILALINVRIGDKTNDFKSPNSFKNILSVNNGFALQISSSPSASTQQQAQLVVNTHGTGSTLEQETIPLPPLPQQKWVLVSILRDGRRFDVMYDDQIVASHRLSFYPAVISNQLIAGDASLIGTALHVFVAPYRLSPSDVAKQRASLVDTNGQPKTTNIIPLPVPFYKLQTACIPGLPCNAVSEPPANPLQAWSSPYS